MEDLLSLKETSELLNVSEQTLRNWDKSGKLKAIRTNGNHRKYSKESIYKIAREKDNKELFKKM
jgi:excisionase family DNA binding protein